MEKFCSAFQLLCELFHTHKWTLKKGDKRQTRCLTSLQLATPREAVCLHAVKVESLLDWLSKPQGPELIDSHSEPPSTPYMAVAIGVDPNFLYENSKGAWVGLGLVFKPYYMKTLSFAEAGKLLGNWVSDPDKSLAKACFILISVSDRSEILPHCGEHPTYLDFISKEKSTAMSAGGVLQEFRCFRLPRALAPHSKMSKEYFLCIGYPRHPGGVATLINPIASKRKHPVFIKEILSFKVAAPSPDHWAFEEDSKYQTWVSSLVEARESGNALNQDKEEEEQAKKNDTSQSFLDDSWKEPENDSKEGEEVDDTKEAPVDEAPNEHTNPFSALMSKVGLPSGGSSQQNSGTREKGEAAAVNKGVDLDGTPVPPEVINITKDILECLHSFHLQSLFEMGSVRVVDRVLAEFLMANFARVNLIMGEDLNVSLQELVSTTEGACNDLLADIKVAMGPTIYGMAGASVTKAIQKYHQRIDASTTRTLVFLDCARRDAHVFLNNRISDLTSTAQFKMTSAPTEWLSNHE